MTVQELNDTLEGDDIIVQIEQFKIGLMAQATDGSIDPIEYARLRKLLLNITYINDVIPHSIKVCRTPGEFRKWMQDKAGSYAERRTIIVNEINPILEILEYESESGALEFKKNYDEKQIIGSGGFGQVYLYEHRLLNLPFAVKIFAPAFYEGNTNELDRFFQEARMLFKLNHPSIIKVYDAGMIGKRPFIRMEYFEGLNLNDILIKFGPLSPHRALNMMRGLTSGMIHAHDEAGIIHRDLKPSNVMASRPNQFRIIDFGLGAFIENELYSRITKTDQHVISGYYNAPELLANPKLLDKRTDVYSLGAIWYTMLTGQPPAGSSFMDNLTDIPEITANYISCLNGCLRNMDVRTESCNALFEQLKTL